jgi:uncharacterized repeat protein (TIGR03803 family)
VAGKYSAIRLAKSATAAAGVAIAAWLCVLPAAAGTYRVLYNFCSQKNCADGQVPGALLMDHAGNMFGTTVAGGIQANGGAGVLFELSPNGSGGFTYSTLYTFCSQSNCTDGEGPYGSLIADTSGDLYGATSHGGANGQGEVFELVNSNGSWTLQVLYNFCAQPNCPDGYLPVAGLAYAGQASGGLYDGVSPLYGTAQDGGVGAGGTVYSLQPSNNGWVEQTLYSFSSPGNPQTGTLLMDSSGNLYGTAVNRGNNSGAGGVFELSPSGGNWNATWLYDFCSQKRCSDGSGPAGGLVADSSGDLWGLTLEGGTACSMKNYDGEGCGTVYSLSPDKNKYQERAYDLCQGRCPNGAFPWSTPLLDGQGDVFGTASAGGSLKGNPQGDGTLFELTNSHVKLLHKFCSEKKCADGENPYWAPAMDASGNLYGSARYGGSRKGGVIYEYTP